MLSTPLPTPSCSSVRSQEKRDGECEFLAALKDDMLRRAANDLPSAQDISELNNVFGSLEKMNYQDFLKTAQLMPVPLRQRYFLASTFNKFAKDLDGCVEVEDFLKYVQRSVDVERVQLELASYASSGQAGVIASHITEQELESFILSSMSSTPLVANFSPPLHEEFLPFFVFTAVRRFLFFLDPMRTRSVNIYKLAHSQEMDEFLWLQRLHEYRDDYSSENEFQEQVSANWFSVQNAIRLYDQYIQLDEDGDGMLSEEEVLKYHGSSRNGKTNVQLTPVVISRIFQENITYQPANMDFKTFLDLGMALENREHINSMKYFWRILDIHKDGKLHPSTVDYFFQDIREMLLARGYDSCPHAADVRTEVMDMLGNEESKKKRVGLGNDSIQLMPVPFKRLISSKQGSTVISMLIDIHKFWAYDNRESLGNSGEEDEPTMDTIEESENERQHVQSPHPDKLTTPTPDAIDEDLYDF